MLLGAVFTPAASLRLCSLGERTSRRSRASSFCLRTLAVSSSVIRLTYSLARVPGPGTYSYPDCRIFGASAGISVACVQLRGIWPAFSGRPFSRMSHSSFVLAAGSTLVPLCLVQRWLSGWVLRRGSDQSSVPSHNVCLQVLPLGVLSWSLLCRPGFACSRSSRPALFLALSYAHGVARGLRGVRRCMASR